MKMLVLSMLLAANVGLAAEKKIVLTNTNHFVINEEFSEDLLSDFSAKVLKDENKELVLYFDSPGGNVISLARMVGVMQAAQQQGTTFTCVTRFAASAAFVLFEYCNNRYILPDGILMAHDASGGFEGEMVRIRKQLNLIDEILANLDGPIAKRMGLSLTEYYTLTKNELWMSSTTAKSNKAVDAVFNNISCAKDLLTKKVNKKIRTYGFFGAGEIEVIMSACPLLPKIEYPKNKQNTNARVRGRKPLPHVWLHSRVNNAGRRPGVVLDKGPQ